MWQRCFCLIVVPPVSEGISILITLFGMCTLCLSSCLSATFLILSMNLKLQNIYKQNHPIVGIQRTITHCCTWPFCYFCFASTGGGSCFCVTRKCFYLFWSTRTGGLRVVEAQSLLLKQLFLETGLAVCCFCVGLTGQSCAMLLQTNLDVKNWPAAADKA